MILFGGEGRDATYLLSSERIKVSDLAGSSMA